MSALSELASLIEQRVNGSLHRYWEEADTYGTITLIALPNQN
jgi:hypothetical protein